MSHPPIDTIDYHTAGEPFRIVTDPPVDLPGDSVADRRIRAIESPSRTCGACSASSRAGTPTCTAGFVMPPDDDGADLGVLFWHKDGFSTACGHGTMALGVWAVESGRVAAPSAGDAMW